MRRSASARVSRSSALPVPLNSSKITSSMRLSVSTSAVATTVREPPSGTARAAPNNPFGLASALASRPPDMVRPLDRPVVLCEREPRERVEDDHDVLAELHLAAGVLEHHVGHRDVALLREVEARRDH